MTNELKIMVQIKRNKNNNNDNNKPTDNNTNQTIIQPKHCLN